MKESPDTQKEPGQYTGSGIAIGVALGAAFGAAFNNIAIGIALGVVLGVAMGAGIEQDAKRCGKVREMSKEECVERCRWTWIALGISVLLGGGMILFAFLSKHPPSSF